MTHSAEIAQFYQEIDIFVLPSLAESWGLAAVEAMAAGVCTLVSSVSGLRELYRDKENCLFLSPTDEDVWVHALLYCADPKVRSAIAKAGQKRTQTLDLNGCFKEKITQILCE
jgi:glycosyltransferase involved in cell wall biosynthesis